MKENSNGTDTNVGTIGNSIEEDIKILEENIKSVKENADMAFFESDEDYYFFKAVEHILSDYKRVLEMNEVLLKENEELKESYMCAQACANMVFDKIIPVQKVKDKIEELNKKEKKELKGMKGQDRYFVKQTYQNKRMILQELIEERKVK